MPTPAVLFDIDGTLVDSNYLHVHAWQRAFDEVDVDVESWRIHRGIGMDGSSLLKELAPDSDDEVKERAKDLHSRFYLETARLLKPLPGTRRLLDLVNATGLQVVLATSAPEDELELLRKVLDQDEIVSAVTSSEDVETAKPQPDIVEVALRRAGVDARQAVFVGDSVWDVQAAARAGVECIGVESGGVDVLRLQSEGAVAVYRNPRDLADHLEDSPIGHLAARSSDGW
ncbi:HAD family hydrolase [Mycobacterium yunnanensis]|uniref:HAD family hydrolase n=1 Tax=Mycobacterium yunnanensis TaxID=368477 RepID=A0A9X2YX37_9MYCO|nr:HAD family hydrolase [Mycobacterium yunnanensis]MCV7419371.1 HAD family hydrolase [Mycobacterium yunnanensis]